MSHTQGRLSYGRMQGREYRASADMQSSAHCCPDYQAIIRPDGGKKDKITEEEIVTLKILVR